MSTATVKYHQVTDGTALVLKKNDEDVFTRPLLRLGGLGVSVSSLSILIFLILLVLKRQNLLSWNYWYIFFPFWILGLFLVILSQSKTLVIHTAFTVRIAWLLTLVAFISFLILLVLFLEDSQIIEVNSIFIPLWIMHASVLCITIFGIICAYTKPKHRKLYCVTSLLICVANGVMFSTILLIELKLTRLPGLHWLEVFIPLWITDAFFGCITCLLCVVTAFNSSDSNVFSVSQLATLLLSLPLMVVFKALLAVYLEGIWIISEAIVFIPIWGSVGLLFVFGVNLFVKNYKKNLDMVIVETLNKDC